MIAVIDNYDSFTFNLVQILRTIRDEICVYRNDEMTVLELEEKNPEGIVISPGPGNPTSAGISCDVIRHFAKRVPILGVCLGHQAIGYAFGAKIVSAQRIVHGKTSVITSDGRGLFRGVSNPFSAMRYHSLAIDRNSLPNTLEISATTSDGEIMGIRLRDELDLPPVEGIQFHPESIMTPSGKYLLRNFVESVRKQQHAYCPNYI
ncbi:MAG: aminodeoxychorismate/anthranilate synthase component II [Thermoguttaceae bacterium]|nr:aminodeoxychorismate/anthranilate synthase component II [Thermoguttaceae bacterium]